MAETLTSLILQARRRSDMQNDGKFISDDEITHMLNDSIADLYGKMVNVNDGSLFATVSPQLIKIGDNSYQLPSDFLRLVDVNIYTGSRWVPAWPSDPQDYLQLLSRTYTGDYDVMYFLHRNNTQDRYELFVFPSKDVTNLGVRYIQTAPTLSVGTDTLKWPSNWHQPVVIDTAIKMLIKEESDPSALFLERDQGVARVLKDIRTQKVAEVKTIRDAQNRPYRRHNFDLPII